MENLNYISVYTREQAIEDGVLVDVSGLKTVFKYPVALTHSLDATLRKGAGKSDEKYEARVWDVAYMSNQPTAEVEGGDSFYPVIVGRETLRLRANVGPGDNAEPVVTIGFPEDF